jgi:hypothetical protein
MIDLLSKWLRNRNVLKMPLHRQPNKPKSLSLMMLGRATGLSISWMLKAL